MRAGLIAYITGLVLASWLQQPGLAAGLALPGALLAFALAATRRRERCRRPALLAGCALLGLGWHMLWAEARLDSQLGSELEGIDMQVSGTVLDLPRRYGDLQQFVFRIEQSSHGFHPRKVLLNDYGTEEILAGRQYRLEIRLKRPRGQANPGAFDQEAWLLQRGIAARGYVRGAAELVSGRASASIDLLRASLRQRILSLTADEPTAQVIVALALGDDSGLSEAQRDLFQRTGTNHLFVISGLHIGLVSVLAYALTLALARRSPLLPSLAPAQKIALLPALAAAAGYAAISGFGLPAQRALVMAVAFMLASLIDLKMSSTLRFLLALAAVLSLNPLSFLGMGFWLSFLAVAALLLIHRRSSESRGARGWLAASVRAQVAIAAALLVPLLLWTGRFSVLGPFVNLLAIPLVGLVIVPLCLFAVATLMLSEPLANVLLELASLLLQGLFWSLDKIVGLAPGAALFEPALHGGLTMTLLAVGSLLLLLPRGLPGRWLAALLLLPLLVPPQQPGQSDLLHLHVLDVGQGLAVIARTRRHVLLYDTGASFSPDASMGDRVVVPVLDSLGVTRLDAVILSHSDDDHSGGFAAVAAALPIEGLFSSFSASLAQRAGRACRSSVNWHWDGVEFGFLHPGPGEQYGKDNNRSCVLQIRAGNFAILLPGDIEAEVEKALALELHENLRSDVLIASHHGSNTSSSWPFLKMVDPDYVIFSAGYRNPFGHPSPQVVGRASAFTAKLLNTSELGTIRIVLETGDGPARVSSFRADHPRYWRAKALPRLAVVQ